MKNIHFESLNKENQIEEIHKNAVFLQKRKTYESSFLLFKLHDYYVEIEYYKFRLIIKKIINFNDPEKLEPYLNAIDIEELNLYLV